MPTTTAAIECYLPEKSYTACLRSAYQKLFVICNAKTQYSTFNILRNAVACNNNKPEFLLFLVLFTYKTNFTRSHNYTNDGYKYVLTIRYQSYPIK